MGASGSSRSVDLERLAEFDRIVEAGPDVEVDGVVRWRRVDLKGVIERRIGVVMAERTVGDLLHARGFSHVPVRPRHPRCDETVQEVFRKEASPMPQAKSRAVEAAAMKPFWPAPAAERTLNHGDTPGGLAGASAGGAHRAERPHA